MRLSTDIDIVVEPGTDVEHYIEIAAERSPGVAYLSACILSDSNCERIDIFDNLLNEPLNHPDIKELKYLKKISPEGYAYAVKTDKILMDLYE